MQELDECRLQVSHTLQSCLQSDGRRRYATPPQQISAFNRRSSAEVLDGPIASYFSPDSPCDIVIGDDVANMDPNGDFNIHFPIRRGDFNLHTGVGGSMTAVVADIHAIWEHVLQKHLNINLR